MSDNIPLDIQMKIMKMFPAKSLIQFRSVSKLWKSIMDSSEFISSYHVNNPKLQHHQLIRYVDFEEKYVSVLDDDTFPQHKSFLTVPMSVNQLEHPVHFMKVMGSSQGLFCFYNYNRYPREDSGTAVIWNPSIRKSVVINVPNVLDRPNVTRVGFAVCPNTNDPKLVKIICNPMADCIYDGPWHIEVYTLNSGVWRTLSNNLPTASIALTGDQEVLEGFIYFLSFYRTFETGNKHLHETNFVIMSFDTINEEFTKISLPNCLHPCPEERVVSMSKLRGSLVVMAFETKNWQNVTNVWMLDHGVTKSFNKIFCIGPPDGYIERVLGFRKSGEAIIILKNDYDDSDNYRSLPVYDPYSEQMDNDHLSLFVYDPYSEHMDNIGISGKAYPLFANCYTETLLLLDQ